MKIRQNIYRIRSRGENWTMYKKITFKITQGLLIHADVHSGLFHPFAGSA